MVSQRNVLTVLGCSGSLALMLSMAPTAVATPVESQTNDRTLLSLTQSDDNPIMDALSCSCASCVMGQTVDI